MKPIILSIVSVGGLCNRMRVMASVMELAEELGCKAFFLWVKMPDMNASFHDLFKNYPAKVVVVKRAGRVFKAIDFLKKHWKGTIIDDNFVYSYIKGKGQEWKISLKGQSLLVHTCENLTGTENYKSFIPTDAIISKADKRIDVNTVGVHIRRTDNEKSRIYSPTEVFIDVMNRELSQNPETKFYLATDDEEEEKYLKSFFGDKILTYKKRTIDRNDPHGIEDALVDLVNLSNCVKIFGSYFSSFSDTAAAWKGIQKIIVTKE